MTTTILFGLAIVLSGWLAALSAATARDERLDGRLGIHRAVVVRRSGSSRSGASAGYALWLGAAAAAGGLAVGWRLAGPVGAAAGAVGAAVGVRSLLARRRVRAGRDVEDQLREAAGALAAAARAGLSVRLALVEAARDAEEPLRGELDRVLSRLDVGEPLDTALGRMAERLNLPDVRLLVTVLSIHRRSGGDLPAMLDEVAAIVAQRVESRRHARALTAQGRASGAVLAVLPVVFVALLSGTAGDGLGAFYRTPLGAALLLCGLTCEALGFAWIRQIVQRSEADR